MGMQNWAEDIVLVDLHREPQMGDEVKTVTDIVNDRGDCDVILDFFQRRYYNVIKPFEATEAAPVINRLRASAHFLQH